MLAILICPEGIVGLELVQWRRRNDLPFRRCCYRGGVARSLRKDYRSKGRRASLVTRDAKKRPRNKNTSVEAVSRALDSVWWLWQDVGFAQTAGGWPKNDAQANPWVGKVDPFGLRT